MNTLGDGDGVGVEYNEYNGVHRSTSNTTNPDDSMPSTGAAQLANQGNAITQELVEKLADKVLALLLDDLRNESERYRLRSTFGTEGGR